MIRRALLESWDLSLLRSGGGEITLRGWSVWWRFHEDEVTRQQVWPGPARRVWPYLAFTVAGLALMEAGAQHAGSRYSDWIGESLVLELRHASIDQVGCTTDRQP